MLYRFVVVAALSYRVLLTVSEKYSSSTSRRGKPRPETLVALSRQYEKDLKVMRELYKRADEVDEVAVMKVSGQPHVYKNMLIENVRNCRRLHML